jgi:hypothetical protein
MIKYDIKVSVAGKERKTPLATAARTYSEARSLHEDSFLAFRATQNGKLTFEDQRYFTNQASVDMLDAIACGTWEHTAWKEGVWTGKDGTTSLTLFTLEVMTAGTIFSTPTFPHSSPNVEITMANGLWSPRVIGLTPDMIRVVAVDLVSLSHGQPEEAQRVNARQWTGLTPGMMGQYQMPAYTVSLA